MSDTLLHAAESRLQEKSHLELTSREIAAAAGTHAAMVNYYFQGKDGLLTELVDGISIEGSKRLRQIETEIGRGAEDPTELIVRALVETTHPHAAVVSIIFIELFRHDSQIKRLYTEHSKLRDWHILYRLEQIVHTLVSKGIYDQNLNSTTAAWMLLSIALGPLFIRPIWQNHGASTKGPDMEEWILNATAAVKKALQPAYRQA